MIKKIHYVWLGGKPLPSSVQSSIRSWKKYCPDWDIIRWDETNFPIGKYKWVREAVAVKKYAFAADFIRLWALSCYGGGYCDTDVTFLRPIEESITSGFVCGIENHWMGTDNLNYMSTDGIDMRTGKPMNGFGMQTGFLYSEPNHPFVQYCIDKIYKNGQRPFIRDDGSYSLIVIDGALIWALKDFKFLFKDETQKLIPNILIYDSSVYASRKTRNKNSYLIHWFDQTWSNKKGIKERIKKFIKQYLYFVYRK